MPDDPVTTPKIALKPCPFCGSRVDWRRYMQVQHPKSDCFLSEMAFTDRAAAESGDEAQHGWNVRHG